MKFGHEYEQALGSDKYPQEWIDSAISYGQLKKCIKRVQRELVGLGLDQQTMHALMQQVSEGSVETEQSDDGKTNVYFEYSFGKDEDKGEAPVTRLVFTVDTVDGVPIDASLTPETRQFLMRMADKQEVERNRVTDLDGEDAVADSEPVAESKQPEVHHRKASEGERTERIQIPLNEDSVFFRQLSSDIHQIDALQEREEKTLSKEVSDLGWRLAAVTRPAKKASKTDLFTWREILEAYLSCDIFYAGYEQDHGNRSAAEAAKRLQQFVDKVNKGDMLKRFNRKDSPAIYHEFMELNYFLLKNVKFIEMQRTAARKIMKKFDKRTSLNVKRNMGRMLEDSHGLAGDMSKALVQTINHEVVGVVPQLDDYLCPICTEIAYKPIKLTCGHLLCVRCTIVMQFAFKKYCPICREETLLQADTACIDPALSNFMKHYFPAESKAKQKASDDEMNKRIWGTEPPPECTVM